MCRRVVGESEETLFFFDAELGTITLVVTPAETKQEKSSAVR